jgi:hypothetical protein
MGITCCAVLLSVYHQAYDLLLLTLPVLALVPVLKRGSSNRPAIFIEAGLFIILAGNYLTTESVLAALHPGEVGRIALLSINGLALLAVFLIYLHVALWTPVVASKSREP